MRTSIRTGVALSVAGLATGGIALLSAGAAEAAATTQVRGPVCRYDVEANSGLNVRKKPAGKKIGALANGTIVFAKKCNNPRGWVKLRGVPTHYKRLNGGWVARSYLGRY